jgi:hypothetical protein
MHEVGLDGNSGSRCCPMRKRTIDLAHPDSTRQQNVCTDHLRQNIEASLRGDGARSALSPASRRALPEQIDQSRAGTRWFARLGAESADSARR